MTAALKILATIGIIYLAVLFLLFIFQRSLIYFPAPADQLPESFYHPFEKIYIPSHDGLEIKSWIAKGNPEKKTIVFFHGNAGNATQRMAMMNVLIDAGYTVVLAEYRGYDDNPGKPSEQNIKSDADKLIEYLLKNETAEKDIVLMGRSLGTGAATYLASKFDVHALVLISPYTSLPDIAASTYPVFPVRLLMHDKFDNKNIIGDVTAPIIMFHGDNDRIIPIRFAQRLFEAAGKTKQFHRLPNSGHNDLDMNSINEKIIEFILD